MKKLQLPVYSSPKIDGIRCLRLNGTAMSRSMKRIPNKSVADKVEKFLADGIDGELALSDPTAPFREVSSAVMSRDGEPSVCFHAFDWWFPDEPDLPFDARLSRLEEWQAQLHPEAARFVRLVPHSLLFAYSDLDAAHQRWIGLGYEGTMLRDPHGIYKQGRSTVREGTLLKWKPFEDAEAFVIGWEPLRKNQNELTTDELGYAKRSTCRDGMLEMPLLGALTVVLEDGAQFSLGSGFTMQERERLFQLLQHDPAAHQLQGVPVSFRFQGPRAAGEKPRIPVFKGFRDVRDL